MYAKKKPLALNPSLVGKVENCIKFAESNRKKYSKIPFGIVCQNDFATDCLP